MNSSTAAVDFTAMPIIEPGPSAENRDEPLRVSTYMVGYFDLLGQSKSLSTLSSLPETGDELRIVESTLEREATIIRELRTGLTEWRNVLKQPKAPSHFEPAAKEQFMRIQETKFLTTGFSDSFVFACQLTDNTSLPNDPEGLAKCGYAIHMALTGLAAVSLMALGAGVPLRGGVEIGLGVNVFENEVYGRVLLDAYELECNQAQYPRILIGPNTVKVLSRLGSLDENQSIAAAFSIRMAKAAETLVCPAPDDGLPMLHFLAPFLKTAESSLVDRRIDAHRWVKQQVQEFSKSGDSKLQSRYERLLRYFDANPW